MIDRGALVLARVPGTPYRGVHRPPLDAQAFTGRRGKDLARRYADGVVRGDGVLEDLDEAVELCALATKIGIEGLEVVVFEVPQEPLATVRMLTQVHGVPADGMVLLGYDAIELIEPFWSPLRAGEATVEINAHGLIETRAAADAFARSHSSDDPLHAVRVWVFG